MVKLHKLLKDLTAGYHTVGVKYGGDDKYNDVVVDGFVIVDKSTTCFRCCCLLM